MTVSEVRTFPSLQTLDSVISSIPFSVIVYHFNLSVMVS